MRCCIHPDFYFWVSRMPGGTFNEHSRKPTKQGRFRNQKGPLQVMTLSEIDMERYLDLQELLAGWSREVQSPARTQITVGGNGFSVAMAAWHHGMQVKKPSRKTPTLIGPISWKSLVFAYLADVVRS